MSGSGVSYMKKKILIADFILCAATCFIMLYSYFNKSQSIAALYIYAIVITTAGILSGAWLYLKEKNEGYINHSYVTSLADDIDTPAIIWTSDLAVIIANQKLIGILGDKVDKKELLLKIFNAENIAEDNIDKIIKNNKDESSFFCLDGMERFFVWNTSTLFANKKYKLLMTIGFDVTELKNVKNELDVYSKSLYFSERKYELSMELSEIGIILCEEGRNSFYVSKELQNMLGLQGSIINFKEFRKKIHSNDKLLYDTFVRSIFKDKDSNASAINNIEMRIKSADQDYHWYLYRYKTADIDDHKTVLGGAFIDITKDKEKDLLIERLAYIDETTNIPNRNKLKIVGQEVFECCIELGISYWVIVLDIDRFHIINDTCGYSNGDRLLRSFAQMLYKYIAYGGFAARIGGDNFAIIIKDYGDDDLPAKTVEKIQLEFSKQAVGVFSNMSLSCSAGYTRMPGNATNFIKALEQAEFAISAGTKNKGTIIGYDRSMHDMIIDGTALEKALADAIDNDELELYYQPKIDLNSGMIIGTEALIRWVKPDGTVILPGKFVPVAETSHLITKISNYVLNEACMQNKRWQNLGLPNIIMSVNLTSADFYHRNIKETIHEVLMKTGLEPQYLEIELTETLAMQDLDLAVENMHKLRSMGVKLAMDDFGTGYSSLSYIQILPITLLKLDRSFIINLETDAIAREIVSSVIKIANSKKIETIAEGIENPAQAEILRKIGCNHAQGFLFGKPMRSDKFADFLLENRNGVFANKNNPLN